VDVLIDRRELLAKARERNLPLGMIEKDYVLGWLLFGISGIKGLVFKGGTALSKIYFPRIWRLSEDIDLVFRRDFSEITQGLDEIFNKIEDKSGISLALKSQHSNPEYLQLKIQYAAVLGKNWVKIDVTREAPIDRVSGKMLEVTYSDYPDFRIPVESLEEIGAEKLRSLLERKKSRDFYDVWRLLQSRPNLERLKRLFLEKCRFKTMEFLGPEQFFSEGLLEILQGYWQREIGRLVYPVPELAEVVENLKTGLRFLKE
jgi:predicted nucleotidyltransferase component of viral defense system